MAWTRETIKGNNSVEPADTYKQGSGLHTADSNLVVDDGGGNFSGPKLTAPGAFKFNQITGVFFNDAGWDSITGKFSKDKISRWFRDDGSTTT
tara:strand:- start:13053 stop:13331 length:279 start_codon:yes stop_codon:yes gene_type:complete